ncbi:MAG: biopolymer transporter ExbD [Myxococcota bacterium]|nr:biopolymer transporter ExbD [Myxococcota bacterium]
MSEINVTPLVDVMLVLLIIFMVATPLIEQERAKQELSENRDKQQRLVNLNLPVLAPSAAVPSDETQTVTLSISEKLVVSIGGKVIVDCSAHASSVDKSAWQPCLDALETNMRGNELVKQFGVSVQAAPRVPFGFVVASLHRMHNAEVRKVGLLPRSAPAP